MKYEKTFVQRFIEFVLGDKYPRDENSPTRKKKRKKGKKK